MKCVHCGFETSDPFTHCTYCGRVPRPPGSVALVLLGPGPGARKEILVPAAPSNATLDAAERADNWWCVLFLLGLAVMGVLGGVIGWGLAKGWLVP